MLERPKAMTVKIVAPVLGMLLFALTSCGPQVPTRELSQPPSPTGNFAAADDRNPVPIVTNVEVPGGDPGDYTFAVTINSPDTGCEQYANWWEVITPEGNLIYRRILAHSHVNEQPFQRSGGPVAIQPDQMVIVRAHMYPSGYGSQAMQGTVTSGFEETTIPIDFAVELANAEPQPQDCAF